MSVDFLGVEYREDTWYHWYMKLIVNFTIVTNKICQGEVSILARMGWAPIPLRVAQPALFLGGHNTWRSHV